MFLSDVTVTRPVLASVLSLLLITFGILSFLRLPLREYPDIDPPVVSIDTVYRGASASVVETRITQIIEERIAGVEGIDFIESISENGRSRITIEFKTGRNVDAAANDIRDRVSGVLDDLPVEADPPDIQKVDSNEDVIMWLNFSSDRLTVPELTDYAERYLVDRFSVLDGVARVRIGGAQSFSMRIWLDRRELAAHGLTAGDVERALREENVELPAGSVESDTRQFTARVERAFRSPEDFSRLVIGRGADGYLVRLGDVARVERAPAEDRSLFRGNGVPMVGLGIIKQSTANTLDVARAAKAEKDRINPTLPDGMTIDQSYDTSIFIEGAILEVYVTLAIAIALVVLVIFLFLGSLRATLVPSITVPVSVVATFIVLHVLGFSVNLITLLALVLAIGLVVDDAIVVLENIDRRIHELRETPLVAAFRGTRQVGFAVVATTLVLVAVFVPIAFLTGDAGRLFSEFALTMAAAVSFSSIVALTLCPMVASKVLKANPQPNRLTRGLDLVLQWSQTKYRASLEMVLVRWWIVPLAFILLVNGSIWLFRVIPSEYAPREDRGAFFVLVEGPEGASFRYIEEYMDEIERRLMRYIESGEAHRLLVRAPGAFGATETFNSGRVVFVLNDWAKRRNGFEIMNEVRKELADLPGVRAFPIMRQGFGAGTSKPVQFVIGGGTYEELAEWRDIILSRIERDNPGLEAVDWDYKETRPQLEITVDYDRAAELGVTIQEIGSTLETLLGSRQVTTYVESGEEYDVLLEGERDTQRTPGSIDNIYVRSSRTSELIPLSNVVTVREAADSAQLNRYNRVRAITIDANLAEGTTLGEALEYLQTIVRDDLPGGVIVDYKGLSRDFVETGGAMAFVFLLGLVVVFLVLAAQFESWVHPFVILLTAPLAVGGGLLGLWLTDGSLNLYSQIGLIMLIGLAAKNGILIVEFANQLRDEGREFRDALLEASRVRLRPILMTAITTAVGAVPLIVASGAGAETRQVIGVVVLAGVVVATVFTLFVVPVGYWLVARRTGSPGDVRRRLEMEAGPAGA